MVRLNWAVKIFSSPQRSPGTTELDINKETFGPEKAC